MTSVTYTSKMKRIEVKRKPVGLIRDRAKEKKILKSLTIDQSGMVIYPGKGSIESRTGSNAQLLIEWFLYKALKEKPIDADMFADLLSKIMRYN